MRTDAGYTAYTAPDARELEAMLDVDALCDRAMAGRERVRIKL